VGFVPSEFKVPVLLEHDRFRLRPISVHDLDNDYDAVMSSRAHLWRQFGQVWGWPPADLTLEQNLADLRWHQEEFQRRSSFDYAVMSPDETRLLGCVYVDPPDKAGHDAEVWLWVRASELGSGLEDLLYATVRGWIEERWPFERVVYPGRELPLEEYQALPDR
jgi:RimJ/RimL family protein N-acetyltransferase